MDFTKLKVGDTVILHMFTGIAVSVKEIIAVDKKYIMVETYRGIAKFSRKTGKQIDPPAKAPRFTNYITENDGSFVPTGIIAKRMKEAEETNNPNAIKTENTKESTTKPKKAKKTPAKRGRKPKIAPVQEEIDEDEYEPIE